jgi:hypothetical protein
MTMRRITTVIAVLLLMLGAVAWLGVAEAQKDTPTEAAADKPDFEAWTYPGAKELGSGQGAGGFYAMLATTDGLNKVEAFYEKKTREKLKPDQAGGHGIGGGAGEARVFLDDSVQPGAKKAERPVVVRVLVQQTKTYDLTLVITRAKGEDYTHIALTYFPK